MKARILALTAALASLTVAAQAQVLLQIDFSNPSAATISSTGAAAAASSSGVNFRIRLTDFFASAPGGLISQSLTTSGNLTAVASSTQYNRVSNTNSGLDFLISRSPGGYTQSFIAGQTALTGAQTVDVTPVLARLRTSTFTGNIEVLSNTASPTGTIIGQYQITAVPEPATMTALALGAAALLRRKRKASVKN